MSFFYLAYKPQRPLRRRLVAHMASLEDVEHSRELVRGKQASATRRGGLLARTRGRDHAAPALRLTPNQQSTTQPVGHHQTLIVKFLQKIFVKIFSQRL